VSLDRKHGGGGGVRELLRRGLHREEKGWRRGGSGGDRQLKKGVAVVKGGGCGAR
jgi:hypothetical protein